MHRCTTITVKNVSVVAYVMVLLCIQTGCGPQYDLVLAVTQNALCKLY